MTDAQVQHVINMLAGIQDCLKLLAFVIAAHAMTSGPSTSGITRALNTIADALKRR